MGKAFLTGCVVTILACVACGEEPHKGPIFPDHTVLANYPAETRAASATERQPPSVEAAEAPPPAPAMTRPVEARAEPAVEAPSPAPVRDFEPDPRPKAAPLDVPADVAALVEAIDRYDSDRDLDGGRHPGELLAFLELSRGMKVAELMAGRGYTTELLARRVGPSGKVWAQNPSAVAKATSRALNERLGKTVMENTVAVQRPADDPLPDEASDLDAVVSVLAYHDAVGLGVDRDKMNKAVFEALKPGGEYVIVDHSASPGRGTKDAKRLHRIEESTVVTEVLRAGFQKGPSAAFLRNPDDGRDGAEDDRSGTSDRFVLKFIRP